MRWLLPLAILVLASCKRSPPPPSTTAAFATTSAAVSASSTTSAPASASASSSAPPARTYPPCNAASPDAALARAHAAMAKKDYDVAAGCFSASTWNSQNRGELAYAQILAGDPATALEVLEELVRTPGVSDALFAQLQFNRGLANDALGKREDARAAYARAWALVPSAAAKEKLAGRSTCVAAVHVTAIGTTPVSPGGYLTRSWIDIAKTVRPSDPAPSDPAAAKAAVCTDEDHPDAGATLCTGALWAISVYQMRSTFQKVAVQPLPMGEYLVVDMGLSGGGGCSPSSGPISGFEAAELSGSIVVERGSASVMSPYPECKDGRTFHWETFYDGAKRRAVGIDGADASIAGRSITIAAPGCASIDFDAIDAGVE